MARFPTVRRHGVAIVAALCLVPAAAAVSGCGGGDSDGNDRDATGLLDRAFSTSIDSADVKLSAQLKIDGLQGFDKPITLEATGPYVSSKDTLPKLDMDITIGASGQGQSLQTGFLSTGDRAFLKFGGEYYEQPKASVAAANRALTKGSGSKRTGTLGLHPKAWVRDATMQGGETIGGVATDHVTAQLDVRKMLDDLNGLARKGANAVGGSTAPAALSAKQLDEATQAVKDPRFDVYVGKKDNRVHRMSGNLSISVPEAKRSKASGISGGTLRFTIDFTNTGGRQRVDAPEKSRPISELSSQLGGAAALGGLGGGSGTATTPGTTTTPGSGTSTTPDADAFKRYSQCLDRAKPGDTQALTRCRSELN